MYIYKRIVTFYLSKQSEYKFFQCLLLFYVSPSCKFLGCSIHEKPRSKYLENSGKSGKSVLPNEQFLP